MTYYKFYIIIKLYKYFYKERRYYEKDNQKSYFNYDYEAYPEYTLPSYFSGEPEIISQAGIKKGSVVTRIASAQMFILSKATMRITFTDDLSSA